MIMMMISELIQVLTQILATEGEKQVVFLNEETGEITYPLTLNISNDLAIGHASEEWCDDEFFGDGAWIENIAPSSPNFPFEVPDLPNEVLALVFKELGL